MNDIYFRQLLAGREVATAHPVAGQMRNFMYLVGGRLVAGDTLFVQGCGRVDLPGGDPEALYHSLTGTLAKLPPETVLYPGHHYGPTETSTIRQELEQNYYLKIRSLEDWRRLMGIS